MSMPEHTVEQSQAKEILPNLGVDLGLWGQRVQRRLKDQEAFACVRRRIAVFLPTKPREARLLTGFFDQQVTEAIAQNQHLDSPVLHLVFSRELSLGVGTANAKPSFMHVVNEAIRGRNTGTSIHDTDWKGVLKIDFTDQENWPDEWKQALNSDRMTFPSWLGSLIPNSKLRDRLLLIIDGYGKDAKDKYGFIIPDDFAFANGAIVRTTRAQAKADQGYGSNWTYKCSDYVENMNAASVINERLERKHQEYDPNRLTTLALAIDRVTARVLQGEAVCLQVPNRYGKTTALKELAYFPEDQRPGLAVTEIDYRGILTNYRYEDLNSPDQISEGTRVMIVDEAGRMEMPTLEAQKTKEIITALESRGVIVVKIYPGNVTPPEEYKVIKI